MTAAVPVKTHIYDPTLGEMFYHDGRVERIPQGVLSNDAEGHALERVTVWAKITKRIGPADEVAMLPAT